MKKNRLLVVVFSVLLIGSGCAKNYKNIKIQINRSSASEKSSIGVPVFDNKATGGARIGKSVTDILITSMVKSKRFKVIERSALEKVMKEQGLQNSGAIDSSTAVQIGKILGIKYILLGSVSQYSPSVHTGGVPILFYKNWDHYVETTIDARVVDVESGAIIASATGEGKWGKGWWKFKRHSSYDAEPGEGDVESEVVNKAFRNAANSLVNDLLNELN